MISCICNYSASSFHAPPVVAVGVSAFSLGPFEWQPILPPAVIALLSVAVLVLTFRSIPRRIGVGLRSGFMLFRAVAIVIVAGVLLNPTRSVQNSHETDPTNRKPLYVVLDQSESMCTNDVSPSPDTPSTSSNISRFEAIRRTWFAPEFLSVLNQRVDPRYFLGGRDLRPTDSSSILNARPDSDGSRLTRHLESILRQPGISQSAGVLFLSDGRDTTGKPVSSLSPEAQRLGVPIFVVPVGTEQQQPDIALRVSVDHEQVYRDQHTTLHAEIRQVGFTGEVAQVRLFENGNEIESRRVRMTKSSTRLDFDVKPTVPTFDEGGKPAFGSTGIAGYKIQVESLPAERIIENNLRHAFIQIQDEKIRVVLFENDPYWDTRFLIGALRNDDQIELTTFIGLNERVEHVARYETDIENRESVAKHESFDPLGIGSGSASEIRVPQSLKEFARYDVVILGRGIERWFSGKSAERLRNYVLDEGGSIIFARGDPCDRTTAAGQSAHEVLSSISPVGWGQGILRDGGTLVRTPEGRLESSVDFQTVGDTEEILTRLPSMIAQTRIDHEKALSTVWLRDRRFAKSGAGDGGGGRGENSRIDYQTPNKNPAPAAIAHIRVGRGQVLAVLSHGLWQWAILPPDEQHLSRAFDLFWTRAIRSLAEKGDFLPGQSVGLSLNRLAFESGETVEIRIETRFVNPSEFESSTLTAVLPSGREQPLEWAPRPSDPEQFVSTMTVSDQGIYRIVLNTPNLVPTQAECRFAVYDLDRELLDTSADRASMEGLARASSGAVILLNQPTDILKHLDTLISAEETEDRRIPGWITIWTFMFITIPLIVEWNWRRRRGLR